MAKEAWLPKYPEMKKDAERLAINLAKAREEMKLSQPDAAALLRCSVGTLSRFENQKQEPPSILFFMKAAEIYERPLSDFFQKKMPDRKQTTNLSAQLQKRKEQLDAAWQAKADQLRDEDED